MKVVVMGAGLAGVTTVYDAVKQLFPGAVDYARGRLEGLRIRRQ